MPNNQKKTLSPLILPWAVWGLAAFFFFSHYVVRVTPGQIIDELQSYFVGASKYDIGILGASFYLPYVLMQLPVGYLVDKFGTRLLLTISVLVCSLSCFLFAHSTHFSMAIFSRVLLGLCCAAGFISALKLITVWFEPKMLALLVGITQALGMVGASAGNGLVPYITDALGWKNTFNLYAVGFFILSMLICLIVRNSPQKKSISSAAAHKSNTGFQLKAVLCNRYTWINALYAGLIFAPTDAMGELWGRDFLRNIHHLAPKDASFCVSLLFIGWAIGGPIAGWLADRIGRKPVMMISAFCSLAILPLLFYVPNISLGIIKALMLLYGLTNTGMIASYAAAGELHSSENAGFSMAIANMFSVLVGAFLMPVLGMLLEWSAHQHLVGGLDHLVYTATDYQRATYVLPVCLLGAIVCSFFVKETLPATEKLN